jgi:uncharacterized protein (TIGR02186 family)
MRRALAALLLFTTPVAAAEDIVSGLSQDQIEINSSYTGADIVVFGTIERPAAPTGRDVVVVVRGPDTQLTVRRRDRIAGVWVNREAARFQGMPAFYFLASTRPMLQIAAPEVLTRYGLGAGYLTPAAIVTNHDAAPFREAGLRQMAARGLYTDAPGNIDFHSESLFKTVVPIPAAAARGQYNVEVYLFRDGDVVSVQSTPFFIDQTGLERRLYTLAHNTPVAYGMFAVLMALLFGWTASVWMRRPGS